ncbi:GNAT family acetyltransferase [Methylacidiphilum caldifontis]|uniref:GNAT family acetyltransferase n=2 Tax=Methylacidiphilum caldifontis TaxID=2795386 RepID=A0A4Y8PGP0_9BACT|nr:GNAT family acetyltransferase [Methylacidiphilum caldifontis]TFE71163.1 GNAT family acetyltransferase [Methylacidiphilum caldifontis]
MDDPSSLINLTANKEINLEEKKYKEPIIRKFCPQDREAVRKICADTGFLGKPIDPIFEDRELFADFLTRYYTDMEPESAFVCEIDGEVVGYIIGCCKPKVKFWYDLWVSPYLLFKVMFRYFFKPYKPSTKKYIHWLLFFGRKQTPPAPKNCPHFHINLLPKAKSPTTTRKLIDSFLSYLLSRGYSQVYGQIVVFGERRKPALFHRFGFQVLNSIEVTKYKEYYHSKVFLYTVIKDLKKTPLLYSK